MPEPIHQEESARGPDAGEGAKAVAVLIAVEVCLYREGLAAALAEHPSLSVVARTADAKQALEAIRSFRPRVVLLDRGMDGGEALVRAAEELSPESSFLALGVREGERDVLWCAEVGCAGFVSRDASIGELVAAIRCAADGELWCSPQIAAHLFRQVGRLARDQQHAAAEGGLTRREAEIVRLIGGGISNKEIARRLRIQVSTVKSHVHSILQKLQVTRRGLVAAHAEAHLPVR